MDTDSENVKKSLKIADVFYGPPHTTRHLSVVDLIEMFSLSLNAGGKIDHAHHAALAQRAFDETVEFAKAVELARKRTSEENTLIVVTADHSHTMSIAGYSVRPIR